MENTEKKDEGLNSKREYPGFRKNLVEYVTVYSEYTGIHGLRYAAEKRRSLLERIVWLIFFCISLYACILLIETTWRKWDTSPVLVSFAKSPTFVWKIPFPAVTICPQTKARQSVYNFTESYNKWKDGELDVEEMKNFSTTTLVCNSHLYSEGSKTIDMEAIEHIKTVAPTRNKTIYMCIWALTSLCTEDFTEVLTEDGMCYTFNMLDKSEIYKNNVDVEEEEEESNAKSNWSLENGYPKDVGAGTYPKRVMSSGFTASLVLLLADYVQDLDYLCRAEAQGFKVILHNPAEVPRVKMRYYQAPLNEELLISVIPDMMTTSEGLRDYDPHKRECFFPHEKYLAFFRSYTQQNCELECLANFTLSKCGCVPYYMPHEESVPICGPRSSQCVTDAEYQSIEQEVESAISGLKSHGKQFSGSGCDCLPACTSLVYNAEFSQTTFNWRKVMEGFAEDIDTESPGIQLARLTIFFKQPQFITSERNELYGTADFYAQCGGILGLFTGFSLLSLVEIIYFISLRMFCNIKMYGMHYWSGSTEVVKNKDYVHK